MTEGILKGICQKRIVKNIHGADFTFHVVKQSVETVVGYIYRFSFGNTVRFRVNDCIRGHAEQQEKIFFHGILVRRGKGVKAGVFNDKTGKVVALRLLEEDNDILAISADGVMIRTHADSINCVGRSSLGVRLMKVSAKDKVVSVSIVEREADEEIEIVETTDTTSEEN